MTENLYEKGAALLAAGQRPVLAEIIEHRGSTPREKGAQMLIWADAAGIRTARTIGGGTRSDGGAAADDIATAAGAAVAGTRTAGTIGGGRVEAAVTAKARQCINGLSGDGGGCGDGGGGGCLFPFELSGADAAGMDMICGGSGTVLLTALRERDRRTLELAAQAIAAGKRAWLVTLLEGENVCTAFIDEEKQVVCGQGLTEKQRKLILDGAGPTMHTQHLEGVTVYARQLSPEPLLYIFGGGHVGLETAALCRRIGFDTVVIDDRREFANADRFPDARTIVAAEPAELPPLRFDGQVYILIMTRGHLLDYQWLKWILALPVMPKYVGMIGSRRKTGMIYERLEKEGADKARIQQVYSPVGLDIGAQTPAEIAVSIAAQIIQLRNA